MSKRSMEIEDYEYVPNAAAQAREAERQRLARWREGATARESEQRRIEAEQARQEAEPITEQDDLSKQVARLAGAWGLKRKKA